MNSVVKGHVSMLGANVMWGLMAPVAKMVMAAGIIGPLLMTDFRIVGAAVMFWLYSLICPKETVPAADKLRLLGAALIGIVFNQGCYIFGVSHTAPGEAAVITTTMPLWVLLLSAVVLKESITGRKITGIVLGGCGALILVLGNLGSAAGGGNNIKGDLLVLTAQLSYACYLTFYKNFIRKYSVVTLMKWMFTFAAVVILPFSAESILSARWQDVTPAEMAGVAYVVAGATFVAYILVMIGQKNLRPAVVGMYNYVQPVVATAVGIAVGLDKVTGMKIVAVAMIFWGVYLVSASRSKAR
ncbi:MAG: DMT family transporter [Duncaniella sp.]|nr:DMT family transporter [Duncaniella sp.]